MPTWGGILSELNDSTNGQPGPPKFDEIRRKYLVRLQEHTGRNVILYASKFTQSGEITSNAVSIVDEDIQGLMEVVHSLTGTDLDLILHSPGGQVEATESFVKYIRSKFSNVRVIVPHLAQSAATMVACSADNIVMGKHSFLGPTDPQIQIRTVNGAIQFVPAQAILEQFEMAQKACLDPKKLAAWMPMLGQYGPHLLIVCENATDLSKSLVQQWLEEYMFSGQSDAAAKSLSIADWLATHSEFKSHGRHLSRDVLKARGLKIDNLEDDQVLQELVLSVFHCATHTFSNTGTVKLIENHQGKAFVKHQGMGIPMGIQMPMQMPMQFPFNPQQFIRPNKNPATPLETTALPTAPAPDAAVTKKPATKKKSPKN